MYDIFSLVEKMNFVRVSGTPEEKRVAEIIIDECAKLGLEAIEEPFATQDGVVSETILEVTAPYHKVYTAIGHRRSASVDMEADIVYAEDGLPVNLADVKDKIILLNVPVNKKNYADVLKAQPACAIVGSGTVIDHEDETDLLQGMLRPILTDDFDDRLAAMTVRMKDLFEMIRLGASHAKIKIVSKDVTNTSRNVIAFIKGTRKPEEIIAFTSHMDSTQFSHGTYDNAAGSAMLMGLAAYYMQNPPERSLRFIWTGSEERGLLGAKYFVSAHAEEVEKTRLSVNCDLAASIAGHDFAIVTGPEELTHYIDMMMKAQGFAVETRTDTYSSDCIPFADAGVPAVSLGRFGAPGMSFIHNRNDVIDYVCAASLKKTQRMAEYFVRQMVGSAILPFAREIPDSMKKKVDEYLMKKPEKDGKNK